MFFMSHRLIIFSISQFVATDNITWWGQRTNLQITDKLWLINLMVEESMDSYNKWTHGTLHLGNIKNCDRYQSVNWGPSWQWLCGRWIYNYLCKQCLSPLMRVRISIRARCTTSCDKVCQSLATGRWFSPGTPVSSTNKSDSRYSCNIVETPESGVKHHQANIQAECELNSVLFRRQLP